MELTITFFITFILGLHIISFLFFLLKKSKFLQSFNFPSLIIDFFKKFSIFNFHYLRFGRHHVDDVFR